MQSWWSSGNTAKACSRCGRGACDPPDLGSLGIACWKLHKFKKKEVRSHLHNLQMLNFRLFSAIFLLVLSLRVFFSFCRSSGTCSGLSCHTIIFIFSLKKEQHPHSVSCHKIFFISNSKETTFSPSLAFLSSSSPLLPTSQTRRESEHSWLSHF